MNQWILNMRGLTDPLIIINEKKFPLDIPCAFFGTGSQ